jgi:hypothetical protein
MRKLIAYCSWLIAINYFLLMPLFAQETLTLTTYYPSPFGVYNELRSKRIAVGLNYYDQSEYKPNDGDSTLAADEIGRYADLIVERYLGVGTHQPDYEFHVKERVKPNNVVDGNRPQFVMESLETKPGTTTPYKFRLKLKNAQTTAGVTYGLLNFYFPADSSEPSDGMFMQINGNQDVRFLGNVNIKRSEAASTTAGLSVQGGVKIGSETTCNPAAEGTQRYSLANKRMEFCNGSTWKPVGGGGIVRFLLDGCFDHGHPCMSCNAWVDKLDNYTGNTSGYSTARHSEIMIANDGSWLFHAVDQGDCSPMTNVPKRVTTYIPVDENGTVVRNYWSLIDLP